MDYLEREFDKYKHWIVSFDDNNAVLYLDVSEKTDLNLVTN